MSTKKVVIGIAIIILALGGIYGGLNLAGKSGDPDAIPVADSPSDEGSEVADPVPDIEVNAPSEPDSGSAIASNESVAEEPLPEEEIIMSTSAGVAKRVKLAEEAQQMESDHGKIEDENQFVSVSGMVYNAQGNGIAGAQVVVQASGFSRDDPATNEFSITSAIQNPEHHFTAITDDAGTYLISEIEYEGWMYVSANAAGYALPRDSRASIQVEPGGKRDGVNVLLTPGVTNFGRVVSPDGLPVGDGTISVLGWSVNGNSDCCRSLGPTYTDSEGRFSISLAGSGSASLEVTSPTYGLTSFSGVWVEDGGEEIVLQMRGTAALNVSLEWIDGTAANDIEILLYGYQELNGRWQQASHLSGVSDETGEYAFDGLDSAMQYKIDLRDTEQQMLSPRVDVGSLVEGETHLWNYAIERSVLVHGLVTGIATGQIIGNVQVNVAPIGAQTGGSNASTNARVHVGADGHYELPIQSGPGDYPVYANQYWIGRDQDAQQYGTTVKLKAGETRELDPTMPDTFTMSIQVYDIGGYPVENAHVVILQGGGGDSNQHTRTDAEGRFSWSGFSPGMACGFSVSSGSSGLARSKIVVGEPGEVVPEEILVLEQFGGIEGVAITEDGKVIQNADIAVNISYGEDKNSLFILKTNEFGEFVTLDDIPATTVTLSMFIDNQTLAWGWDSQAFVVPAENVVNPGKHYVQAGKMTHGITLV